MSHPEPHGDARDERLAQNEVIFRTVNDAIHEQAIKFGGPDSYQFICECATTACLEMIPLTLDQYERIRGEGTAFIVAPGHVYEGELATDRQVTHWVVRKDGAAGVVSEFADSQDGDSV